MKSKFTKKNKNFPTVRAWMVFVAIINFLGVRILLTFLLKKQSDYCGLVFSPLYILHIFVFYLTLIILVFCHNKQRLSLFFVVFICIALLIIPLLSNITYSNNSIIKHNVFSTKKYQYIDIESVSLSTFHESIKAGAIATDEIAYTIFFNDGTKIELNSRYAFCRNDNIFIDLDKFLEDKCSMENFDIKQLPKSFSDDLKTYYKNKFKIERMR